MQKEIISTSSIKEENSTKKEEKKSKKLNEEEENGEEDNEEEEDDEESSDEEMDLEDDERVENMEKMNFDFEAFPPDQSDLEGIEGLLQQIFLRADVDIAGLAKAVVAQAPMGCVYKPAEEYEQEMGTTSTDESLAYGVISIVGLNGTEKFQSDIVDFVLKRANKYATSDIAKQFEKCLSATSNAGRVGLLVNERLLQFPAQISAPAFASIREDFNAMSKREQPEHILTILKIRMGHDQVAPAATTGNAPAATKTKSKRKMGKAEKKRLMAAQLAEAETIFDNPEEQLLFMPNPMEQQQQFPFFQYPVESEVERGSKFHCIRRDGHIYRPYRRICLLNREQFLNFADIVPNSNL